MSSLVSLAEKAPQDLSQYDDKSGLDIDAPIPEGLPKPRLWRLMAVPVRIRRVSKGGIILSDDSRDVIEWHHQLFRIVAVGPQVYEGPTYQKLNIDPEDKPKLGDLVMIDPKTPRRFRFKGMLVIIVNDDQIMATVPRESVEHLSFYGLDL